MDRTSATSRSSSLPVWFQCWTIRWEVTWDKTTKNINVLGFYKLITDKSKELEPTLSFLPACSSYLYMSEWMNEYMDDWLKWNLILSHFYYLTPFHGIPPSHLSRSWERLSLKSKCCASSRRSLGCRLSQQVWSLLRLFAVANQTYDGWSRSTYIHPTDVILGWHQWKNSMSSKETLRAASWFLRMRRVIARLCFSNRKIRSCRKKVSFCVVWLLLLLLLYCASLTCSAMKW